MLHRDLEGFPDFQWTSLGSLRELVWTTREYVYAIAEDLPGILIWGNCHGLADMLLRIQCR